MCGTRRGKRGAKPRAVTAKRPAALGNVRAAGRFVGDRYQIDKICQKLL